MRSSKHRNTSPEGSVTRSPGLSSPSHLHDRERGDSRIAHNLRRNTPRTVCAIGAGCATAAAQVVQFTILKHSRAAEILRAHLRKVRTFATSPGRRQHASPSETDGL